MTSATKLLEDLVQALIAQDRAKADLGDAKRRQAELLCQLRRFGFPTSRVVQRIAAIQGKTLPIKERLKFARCLRKRAERETARRADLAGAHGLQHPATAPSDQAAISPLAPKENTMPQILKRTTTTTEEFVQPDELDGLEPSKDEIDLEEFEDPEEKKGSPVRRRHR